MKKEKRRPSPILEASGEEQSSATRMGVGVCVDQQRTDDAGEQDFANAVAAAPTVSVVSAGY